MNNSPVILFDIDYTLFNVLHFDENFPKYLAKLLFLDEEKIRSISIETITGLIKKEGFLDISVYLDNLLSKLGGVERKQDVEEFLFAKDFFKLGFYPEVGYALGALKDMFRLGIFSQGDIKLQGAKLTQSGLKHFFDEDKIYIKKPHKLDFLSELSKKHKNDQVFLVDDKLEILYEAKKAMPFMKTIWVKRGRYANSQKPIEGFEPDAFVNDLAGVVDFVKSKA